MLEGTLTVTVEREDHDLGPFDAIRVAPGLRRELANRGPVRVLVRARRRGRTRRPRREAFASWDDTVARLPAELPLPADLPVPRDVPVPPDLRT